MLHQNALWDMLYWD